MPICPLRTFARFRLICEPAPSRIGQVHSIGSEHSCIGDFHLFISRPCRAHSNGQSQRVMAWLIADIGKEIVSRITQAAKKRHAERIGRVPVNESKIRSNGLGPGPWIPECYDDVTFTCKDCGSQETWTATQQKWWYEVAGGSFDSTAIRCRSCRTKEKARKIEARRVHFAGIAKKKPIAERSPNRHRQRGRSALVPELRRSAK